MKICSKCGRELPIDCFPADKKGKGGVSSQCADCRKAYYKQQYECGKRFVDSCKTHCAKCGCATHYVLTFHHIDYRTKSFDISKARRKQSSLVKEMEKCICLCHNCHQTFHYFYGHKPKEPVVALNEFLKDDWTPGVKIT